MILKQLKDIECKEDKLEFLKKNYKEVLKAKKAITKEADNMSFYSFRESTEKAEGQDGVFSVVGNSIGFMDSHDDVSLRGSFDKTVRESGNNVPILKDHRYSVDNLFAVNEGVRVEDVKITSLGYNETGKTQALVANIRPIEEDMKRRYEEGVIKQHSIGLRYVKLELAINDEDSEEGFKMWNKYIDQVINRERAEELGYFFAVVEQKLIEISAVVFGSNPYTPPLKEDKNKSLENDEPLIETLEDDEPIKFDYRQLF